MDIEKFVGSIYPGTISVAVRSKSTRTVLKTILKNPRIEKTSLGIMLEDCSGCRLNLNYASLKKLESISDDNFRYESGDDMIVSIALIINPVKAGF